MEPFQRIVNHRGWPLPKLSTEERAKMNRECTLVPIPRPADLDETLDPAFTTELAFFPADKSPLHRYAWARGMTDMRAYQSDRSRSKVIARVLLGGPFDRTIQLGADGTKKERWYVSRIPGVLEEALLSIKAGQPLFLIGAFGGATKLVIDLLQSQTHYAANWEFQSRATFAKETRTLYAARNQSWWYYDSEERIAGLPTDDPRSIVDFLAEAWKPNPEKGWETCINPLTRAQNQELFETTDPVVMAELLYSGLSKL